MGRCVVLQPWDERSEDRSTLGVVGCGRREREETEESNKKTWVVSTGGGVVFRSGVPGPQRVGDRGDDEPNGVRSGGPKVRAITKKK